MMLLTDAGGDDGLFLKLGMNIANGKWLGPFNVFSLAKGPGYPLFLAASWNTGLPVTVSQALLMIFGAGLFSFMVAKVARSAAVGLGLFVATILHPAFIMERILRDAIYTAQTYLIFGLLIGAFMVYRRYALAWGSFAGLATSWFWLTREEGVWLLPALAALIGFSAIRNWIVDRDLHSTLLGLAGFVVLFALGQSVVSTVNWWAYGRYQTVDVKEPNFQAALTALQSVRDGQQIPYVPVSKSTRQFIYKVSPTFAAMKPTFDPASGDQPGAGCQHYPWTCGEIAGGWFMFYLKGSAAHAGAYKSPDAAAAFFKRLATEIIGACRDKRLTCEPNPVPFMPRVTLDQVKQFPAKLWEGVRLLFTPPKWRLMGVSTGTPQQIADAVAFLNDPMSAKKAAEPENAALVKIAVTIRDWWGPIVGWIMTALLPIGLVSIILATAITFRRKTDIRLVAIAGTLWLLLFARLGLIAMIEISSFPATNKWYLGPALYLSLTASLLSVICLLRKWSPPEVQRSTSHVKTR
jgi:hypothetical protein